ncbi:MAG: HEPN domain-containing protein [Deltaproteobacteria bacterium]|nr:HEPN domain-containing protein [Deltaproteobacteria bacterium]
MKQSELALLYLRKAAEDEALIDEVIASPRVSDAAIGFHCQQAAEKLLKALLAHLKVRARRLVQELRGWVEKQLGEAGP